METVHFNDFTQASCLIVKQDLDPLQKFFILTGVLQYGLILGLCFTAVCIKGINWEFWERKQTHVSKIISYVEKYPLRINVKNNTSVDDPENNCQISENSYVMDTTPSGSVVMRYNPADEIFEYYADKTIAYPYLETVARKFCNTFGVPEYFVGDTITEYIYDEDEEEETQENEETEQEETENNEQEEVGDATPENDNKENDSNSEKQEKTESRRNAYRLLGMVRDFDFTQSGEYKKIERNSERQKMTFDMFKQMFGGGSASS